MLPFLPWLLAAAAQAPAPQVMAEDQQVLAGFSAPAAIPGGPIWITLLSNRSIEALWRDDPARRTLHTEVSNAGTAFYVMGLATRPLTPVPRATLIQGDKRIAGRVVNLSHLNGAPVPEGAVMLGLIEFADAIDPARPFTIEFAGAHVAFAIDPALARRFATVTPPPAQGY